MSESRGHDGRRKPSGGQLLALHQDHRKGLHRQPVPDCIQCTFDTLTRQAADGLSEPMTDPEST